MAQILVNSRMSAEGAGRCARTPASSSPTSGSAWTSGGKRTSRWRTWSTRGVRRAYLDPDNLLRASIVAPPFGARRNTATTRRPRCRSSWCRAARWTCGGGEGRRLGEQGPLRDAEPERQHRRLGAPHRPRNGGRLVSARNARSRDRRDRREGDGARQGGAPRSHRHARAARARAGGPDRGASGSSSTRRSMRSGSAPRGSGGLTTVLDVKVKEFPTHAAGLPVAMIPNCAATRHLHFVLDGSGPAEFEPTEPRGTGRK